MDYYFVGGFPRVSCFFTAALLLVVATTTSCSSPFSITDLRSQEADVAGGESNARVLSGSVASNKPRIDGSDPDEKAIIHSIRIPFLQGVGDWMQRGKGISMCSNGEPKSGTSWTERIITELAVQLCGSPTNTWCKMGGIIAHRHNPAPDYLWEMLYADTGELFLHFNGRSKHEMIGLNVEGCNPRGRQHRNGFETDFPCLAETKNRTRESIYECLPDTSERCTKLRPSQDPADLRISSVFRDPRDVVISELRMRNRGKEFDTSKLNSFIYNRFEAIVSWQYYRWMWYTTYYKNVSHIMFYEDIKSKPEALAALASFMGLNSSPEQIRDIQEMHRDVSPNGKYDTYGLPLETLQYMNATMSKLSPERLLARYGLSPYLR